MKPDWKIFRLGDITDVQTGGTPLRSKQEYWNGELPWYSSGELNETTTSNPERHITSLGLTNSNAKLFPKGSLLVGIYDTAALKMSILDREAAFNQAICGLKPKDGIDLKFIYFAISSMKPQILSLRRGVRQKNLSLQKIKNISIPLPPLPEQKRIVAILDEAFAGISQAIANTERNLKNARELFEIYLDEAFVGHGRKWQETRLSEILSAQPRNGWSPPAQFHADKGTPVLTLSSVTGFNFDKSKIKYTSSPVNPNSHYWAHNGDLFISRSNTHELVGHVAICSGITEPVIYPDLIMKMEVNSSIASTGFIYYQLRSRKLRAIISNSATGANPTMKKINKSIVQNLPLVLPSLKEQEEITRSIKSLSEKSERYSLVAQQKLTALAELKQSILQQAFTGQLTDNLPL